MGLIPMSGRFPGERNGNLLKCSSLEDSIGTRKATVHGVAKSQTWLNTHTPLFLFEGINIHLAYLETSELFWHFPMTFTLNRQPTPILPTTSLPCFRFPWAVYKLQWSYLSFKIQCLEKETATHSSVLAWRIPGMGKPGGLPSLGSHRVRHDWSNLGAAAGRPGVLQFMGSQRVRHDWATELIWTDSS